MRKTKPRTKKSQRKKALVLLSNGLDSRLACKIMQDRAVVQAIFFLLPFSGGCCADKFCVWKFCQKQRIKLHIVDLTKGKLFKEYLSMIKSPKFPRGTALNPCIDCHAFMLKKAKEFADKNKIPIIATGEVLDQRPLSQTQKAMRLIDQELGFSPNRPLIELGISGRQRKKQIQLAAKYNIDYPNPAGGCLLCEPGYCEKLKPLLHNPGLSYFDILLLSLGRHFDNSQIVLGRNKQENEELEKIHKTYKTGLFLIPKQPGPSAIVKDSSLLKKAKQLMQEYSKHKIRSIEVKKLSPAKSL